MSGDIFVDTNILVYAHDADAGEKHLRAKSLVQDAWEMSPPPWISVQVLQELLATLRRKGVSREVSRQTVEDYMHWRVIDNTVSLFSSGLEEMDRWMLSLWDAMILAAARLAGVDTVWSEDFSHDQDYGGLIVSDPLS